MAGDVGFVICDGGRCGVCDLRRPPGAPCKAWFFWTFDARCYPSISAFLWAYPRLQRCGCATLRHKSLRSLTASTIVGPLLSGGVAVASSREAGPLWPGAPCKAWFFWSFDARCYPSISGFLWAYSRLQRCGCATLRHKSLRSLTASTIVGPLLSGGVAVASSREAGPL